MRIVVLGGGLGGVATVRHLERLLRAHADIEIALVSRENFFVLTPLLFEACSGRLELRHCAQPIRAALRRTRFIEATSGVVDPADLLSVPDAALGQAAADRARLDGGPLLPA